MERTSSGNSEGAKITFNIIKQRLNEIMYKLTAQKFEDPGAWHSKRVTRVTMMAYSPRLWLMAIGW